MVPTCLQTDLSSILYSCNPRHLFLPTRAYQPYSTSFHIFNPVSLARFRVYSLRHFANPRQPQCPSTTCSSRDYPRISKPTILTTPGPDGQTSLVASQSPSVDPSPSLPPSTGLLRIRGGIGTSTIIRHRRRTLPLVHLTRDIQSPWSWALVLVPDARALPSADLLTSFFASRTANWSCCTSHPK
jgi:hypothetical protein